MTNKAYFSCAAALAASIFSGSASAADPFSLEDITLPEFFQGSRGPAGDAGRPWIPSPNEAVDWGLPQARPSIGAAGTAPRLPKDPFHEIAPCRVVDFVNVRRPTLAETLDALKPCAAALSVEYGVAVTAVEGTEGVVFVLPETGPSGSRALEEIRHGLSIRENRIHGYPAAIVDLKPRPETIRRSSLQNLLRDCLKTQVLHRIESGSDFIGAYGGCLRGARGVKITDLRQDPILKTGIIVYGCERLETLSEMNGLLRVMSESGPVEILVHAKRELLSDGLLRAMRGSPVPAAF